MPKITNKNKHKVNPYTTTSASSSKIPVNVYWSEWAGANDFKYFGFLQKLTDKEAIVSVNKEIYVIDHDQWWFHNRTKTKVADTAEVIEYTTSVENILGIFKSNGILDCR